MDSSQEARKRQQDEEFDHHLVQMKPFVLRLPHKSERQCCALWIKKLCEPHGSGVIGRKNRNMYSKLLLHMLKRGVIEGPFTSKPESGPLPTLPSYMAIYFDDPISVQDKSQKSHFLPDWVTGELGEFSSTHPIKIGEPSSSSTLRSRQHIDPNTEVTWSPRRRTKTADDILSRPSDTDFEAKVAKARESIRSRSKPLYNLSSDDEKENGAPVRRLKSPRRSKGDAKARSDAAIKPDWLSESDTDTMSKQLKATAGHHKDSVANDEGAIVRAHEKEMEMKTKMLEAKFHEEKLTIQQLHDQAIQKILDRKNAELEDIKSHYRTKGSDLEDANRKLQKRVNLLVNEVTLLRESKERQVAELKAAMEHTSKTTQNQHDKQLHDAIADFEQEKFEMQKAHTKNIQGILEDTNARLQQMEEDYGSQVEKHANVIKELEARLQELMEESENIATSKLILNEEKMQLEDSNNKLAEELRATKTRFETLHNDHVRLQEDSGRQRRSLQVKTDASIEYLKQEHALALSKSVDTISELGQQIQELKKSLQESEQQRQRQFREWESIQKQDKMHMEHLHENKLHSLKKEHEQEQQELNRRIRKLEQTVSEKEAQILKCTEAQKAQAQQSQQAIEGFRAQVEKNSSKMFDDMKEQMIQVEADLQRSKSLREQQTREFTKQQQEETQNYEKMLSDLKLRFEQEKVQLLHDYHIEKETMRQNHDKDLETHVSQLQGRLEQQESLAKDRQEKDAKKIGNLELQLGQMKEELVQSNALRKQQLTELGLIREEEKQTALRENQSKLNRLQSEFEQKRLQQQQQHGIEIEKTIEQSNTRLKEIEKEYKQRLSKSAETIAELKTLVEELKEKFKGEKATAQYQKTEVKMKLQEERENMRRIHDAAVRTLQSSLDSQKSKVRQLEKRLQQKEFEQKEQITQLKQEHENRLRGLLPQSVHQELEKTISSLKSQVNTLQQRANVMQEEIDAQNTS
ncbi:centrosomal protein of 112 kDa-like [Anneissia japonica]|uniref:centrosomal protein of 112 kDa-like n=1 Tax=Anneissia japonica TaxID=1529436 RepID=UPI001425583A|nr:centrosomal protein of 112 kDa-like [Anneissia japonica]XP_033097474.1 centrosomal protein of 112 kDa-like [Anneissia japonica]